MKKTSLLLIALAISLAALAQPRGYNNVYHTYKGEPGVTSIKVPGILLRFAGMCAGLDHEERCLVRSMKSVTVLTIDDNERYKDVNFVEEMDPTRMRGDYNLLMRVNDSGEDVIIAAREKNGRFTDLIVVVGGNDNTLVHIKGRMKSDLFKELADVTGIKELEITAEI